MRVHGLATALAARWWHKQVTADVETFANFTGMAARNGKLRKGNVDRTLCKIIRDLGNLGKINDCNPMLTPLYEKERLTKYRLEMVPAEIDIRHHGMITFQRFNPASGYDEPYPRDTVACVRRQIEFLDARIRKKPRSARVTEDQWMFDRGLLATLKAIEAGLPPWRWPKAYLKASDSAESLDKWERAFEEHKSRTP